ncbi:MAG: hypothetical protein IT159_15500 [Bryobacterales bacterium]|nr:hypothetical protein [Bryobacterales bacterium]
MALFTDGTISTLEDLRGYESSIYDVASTERIDLSQKLVLSQQEMEVDLITRLFRDKPTELTRVVVTAALQLWHTFQTLALTYRDAYNSHLNDRYQGKWREYERLAKWAAENLMASGVGMVEQPIPKAQPPVLSAAAGSAPAAMYWVRISWTGPGGQEGCASEPSVLAAPEGTVPRTNAGAAPPIATGWNVYVGANSGEEQLQNVTPIPLGSSWTMPETGLTPGRPAWRGQSPTSYKRLERVFRRG